MPDACKILVLGNSHTNALSKSVEGDGRFEVHWMKLKANARFGTLEPPQAYDRVARLSPSDRIVVMLLGTAHNVLGLLNTEEPFTFAGLSGTREDATLIPRGTMLAQMLDITRRDVVLETLVKRAPCPIYHCMTPPPKKMLQLPASSDKAYHGRSIRDMGFAPAELRREMWRLEYTALQSYCAEIGVTLLDPPDGTTTQDGFLHADYHASDATHANVAYAEKMKDQFVSLLA